MGQTGIRAVLGYTDNAKLKQALRDQLQEYDTIEQDALDLASQKG